MPEGESAEGKRDVGDGEAGGTDKGVQAENSWREGKMEREGDKEVIA